MFLWYNNIIIIFILPLKESVLNMEKIIDLDSVQHVDYLFGNYDENIKLLEKKCFVKIVIRNGNLKLNGEEENLNFAEKVINQLLKLLNENKILINKQNIEFILDSLKKENLNFNLKDYNTQICLNFKKKPILTKTLTQKQYSDFVDENSITFAIGIAGTGKTYIAVAKAVCAFKEKKVEKIVLTRPVVEAGERLGFLPGDFQSKIDPYLRPLYDIMEEIVGVESLNKLLERKKIEILPLAYMRGRTLSNSFIILDEAQNTTSTQMKMFLTRLGSGSKMVITGDVTQIDLENKKESGLLKAVEILKNIKDIAIVSFSKKDVVRHKLVQQIIKAYENN